MSPPDKDKPKPSPPATTQSFNISMQAEKMRLDGRFDEAIPLYDILIQQKRSKAGDPAGATRLAFYIARRAECLSAKGKLKEAATAADEALKVDAGGVVPMLAKAALLEAAGKTADAIHWYDKAIAAPARQHEDDEELWMLQEEAKRRKTTCERKTRGPAGMPVKIVDVLSGLVRYEAPKDWVTSAVGPQTLLQPPGDDPWGTFSLFITFPTPPGGASLQAMEDMMRGMHPGVKVERPAPDRVMAVSTEELKEDGGGAITFAWFLGMPVAKDRAMLLGFQWNADLAKCDRRKAIDQGRLFDRAVRGCKIDLSKVPPPKGK